MLDYYVGMFYIIVNAMHFVQWLDEGLYDVDESDDSGELGAVGRANFIVLQIRTSLFPCCAKIYYSMDLDQYL